jgi:acyl-CoA synthetase (NDP forming)
MAGSHEVFSAACRQQGAVVVNDLMTLYDSGKGLAWIRPPKGRRLLIISTSGGAGTLASDEAESMGLCVPSLSSDMKEELGSLDLSPLAHLSNPMDLAGIEANHFLETVRLADRLGAADTILVSFADPVAGSVDVIKTLVFEMKTSLAVSYMGGGDEEARGRREIQRLGVPVFPSPERAIRGIAAAVWKAEYCRRRIQTQKA